MLDTDELETVLDADEDNAPAALRSPGTGGSKPAVSPEEQRERRLALGQLMSRRVGRDEQNILMEKRFGMNARAVDRLRKEVIDDWAKVDAEEIGLERSAWLRRNYAHIQRAAKDGQWSAVFKGEDTVSKVLGIQAPMQVEQRGVIVHAQAPLGGALKSVIMGYSDEQLVALAQQGRLLAEKTGDVEEAVFEPAIDMAAIKQVEHEFEKVAAAPVPRRKRSEVSNGRQSQEAR